VDKPSVDKPFVDTPFPSPTNPASLTAARTHIKLILFYSRACLLLKLL